MIVWTIGDILVIGFCVLVFLVLLILCIVGVIQQKLHDFFRRKKDNKESEK